VKTVEVAKVRRGSVFRLDVIVCVVVDPLVVSSDCMDCDRIDGDGGVSSSCCCCYREPCDPNE